jgi:anti-sigma-K factor RskA
MSRTPRPADHEAFDELAVGWALHALEPDDEAAFALHLPDCPRCARTVADTQDVMAALAADLPQAEPSDGLRHRLRAAVEQTEQVRRPPVPPPARPRGAVPAGGGPPVGDDVAVPRPRLAAVRERGWAIALAAAVAAVVGLGIWNVAIDSDRDRAVAAAAEQSALLEELLQPGSQVVAQLDQDGKHVATVVARDDAVQVVSQGLAVNDETVQTYVLWGVRGDGAPDALGTFDVVRSRPDLNAVRSSGTRPTGYDQYAVSLEPGRQPPAKPSAVLAIGQVTS